MKNYFRKNKKTTQERVDYNKRIPSSRIKKDHNNSQNSNSQLEEMFK